MNVFGQEAGIEGVTGANRIYGVQAQPIDFELFRTLAGANSFGTTGGHNHTAHGREKFEGFIKRRFPADPHRFVVIGEKDVDEWKHIIDVGVPFVVRIPIRVEGCGEVQVFGALEQSCHVRPQPGLEIIG